MDTPPDRRPAPGDTARVMALLWKTGHAIDVLSKQMWLRLGVTGPQRMILRVVAAAPGSAAGEVAAHAGLHPSTVTGLLDRLERGGLICRERDPSDHRRARLTLTEAGRAIDRLDEGTVESALTRALGQLSDADAHAVTRWLTCFAAELDAEQRRLGARR